MTGQFTGPVAAYPTEFLECRVSGHAWRWLSPWRMTYGPGGQLLEFSRLRRCDSCNTLVNRRFDGRTGASLGGSYYVYATQPAPYLVAKHALSGGAARLEALRRETGIGVSP